MSKYDIEESDQFLRDIEECAVWILVTNIDESESLALKKVAEFQKDINSLKERLSQFPESGESDKIHGLRKFPVYDGRYSAKWIVNHINQCVTLISLVDSKYPIQMREFQFDE